MSEFEESIEHEGLELDIVQWIVSTTNEWRDHYETNYQYDFEEFYRIWRSKWAEEDKTRQSERSRLVAPATQQAVESNVAEIEEATFSNGRLFDLEDDAADEENLDMISLRDNLTEDFELARVRSAVGEVLINAAVCGTGIGEIVMDEVMTYAPATQSVMDGSLEAYGVNEVLRPVVKINPVMPQNFLIDPVATCIDDAMGCAIEEFVSIHAVEMLQDSGVYKDDVVVTTAPYDEDLEPDPDIVDAYAGRTKLIKYYGLVPRECLENEGIEVESEGMYVEAIVVIGGENTLLKVIENPYMCKDRPVVAFSWDVVPSKFWGRGVCEKGYMSQKALDAEMRARIDALGLTTHPMMGVDASRIPRGASFEVRPGKMLMTNGNPSEILQPFNFGQVDQITFAQAGALQQMVQSATGAVDSAGLAGNINGDATAAGMSMSLGAIIKRQKRTLVNFQENFLMPFVRKAAWRYMQFYPDVYKSKDYKFRVVSSLGVIAREYEVGQLTQLIQGLPPESPAHNATMKAIIEHLNVTNREEIIAILEKPPEPDPEAAERQAKKEAMEIAVLEGQLSVLAAQAAESNARAAKYAEEVRLMPEEMVLKYSDSDNDGEMDKDFEKKLKVADLHLRERAQQVQEKQAGDNSAAMAEAQLIEQLTKGTQQ